MCRIYGQFSPGEYVRNTKCEKLTLYMADFPCNICPLITQKDILHINPTSDGIQLYLLTYFHYEKGFVPQSLAPQMIMGGSGE